MSTRGLMSFRFQGKNYVTYQDSDTYPKCLGARIIHFAQQHLKGEEAIQAFGKKVAALNWQQDSRNARNAEPQGGDLLAAIAAGSLPDPLMDDHLFQTCMDCEFAYILNLDDGVLEFWDLPEKVATFPLASLSTCAVDIMECERRR